MSTYNYNGVTVQYCRTLEFISEPVYDPTNTDVLWQKYTIRVRGFVSAETASLLAGIANDSSSALAAIKNALETPRQRLVYSITGTNQVSVLTPPDDNLGPHPLPCRVREVTSGLFLVECGCVAEIVECDNECPTSRNPNIRFVRESPVISLRWGQTESFDENWYSKLTTDGLLIVRASMLQSADSFRTLCTPGIMPNYVRTAASYTLQPDGLRLRFHFEDQERDRLPPFPATKARGTYSVMVPKPGFLRVGTAHITLEGQRGTSRKELFIRACSMCLSKLAADQFLRPGPPIIWGNFKEDLFNPVVDVAMTAMMTSLQEPSKPVEEKARAGVGSVLAAIAGPFLGLGAAAALVLPKGGAAGAGAARSDVEAAPRGIGVLAYMPSVGQETDGLTGRPKVVDGVVVGSEMPGIAPPDRKSIEALLTALFTDPCACIQQDIPFERNTEPGSFDTNPNIVPVPGDAPPGGAPPGGIPPGGVPIPGLPDFPTPPVADDPFGFVIPPTTPGRPQFQVSPNGTQFQLPGGVFDFNIGPIAPLNLEETALLSDTAPYDTYEIEVTTTFHVGKVQMPGTGVGSDGDVSAVVKTHGGMMEMTTTWVAGRTGAPPVLPAFYPKDTNLVPIGTANVVANAVVPSPDGESLVYLVAGSYRHAILDPKKHTLRPPVAPFFTDLVSQGAQLAMGFWADLNVLGTPEFPVTEGTNVFNPTGEQNAVAVDQEPIVPPGFQQDVNPSLIQSVVSPSAAQSDFKQLFDVSPVRP